MTSPNALLLQRMNALKDAASVERLSAAQQEAMDQIRKHRDDDARFINLYGPEEAGKTFLCWALREAEDWEYHPQMPESADEPVVIYDHGEADRMATRNLRNHASINGLATIVYVTHRPAEEVFPRVELAPGEDHYQTVRANWEALGLSVEHAPTM
ncbi:hypothetical protein [Halobacterium litoreum]|uniref:Uncharacterized protein n=1 Tax=Halobacterium litoreum TaxID=2039234 RepID=A0ABD5NFL7_9EURY|nr:hypothetical protein [Halobacterium litoreum]UHH13390.1 hypothetical protein LT972_14685 [Halobacterium litoreum]